MIRPLQQDKEPYTISYHEFKWLNLLRKIEQSIIVRVKNKLILRQLPVNKNTP